MNDLAQITTVFNYNNRLTKKGEAPVHIMIYYKGKRSLVNTGISVAPEQWDQKKKSIIRHPSSNRLNVKLRNQLGQYLQYEEELLRMGKRYQVKDIVQLPELLLKKEQAEKQSESKASMNFIQFVGNTLHERNDLKKGTIKNHDTFINRFTEFDSSITMSDIDYKLLKTFENFLLGYEFTTKAKEVKRLQLTRIAKYLKTFHSYIRIAIKEEYLEHQANPFLKFEWAKYYRAESLASQKRRHLTGEQVQALADLKFTKDNKHLLPIRDFFLLQCYTGLAYGDMIRLSKDNIKHKVTEHGGGIVIEYARKKTSQPIYIPVFLMSAKAEALIRKYNKEDRPYLFDQLSDQHINRELKVLAKLAGITEKVSTHIGRHSCAMWLRYKGLSDNAIMQILGHTNITTTLIYAKLDQRSIENELNRAFKTY